MPQSNQIDGLVGREVNAVCFVMDYVEIHFNGPLIRCIADPELILEDGSWRFPEKGSREKLCCLIGRRLTGVEEDENVSLALRFSPEGQLKIPLSFADRFGGEALHFVPGPDQPISVW